MDSAKLGRLKSLLQEIPKCSNDCIRVNNQMAKGNYPAGMHECEVVGIQGGCGKKCFVLQEGRCPSQEEMEAELLK